jgi:hypothetical protein
VNEPQTVTVRTGERISARVASLVFAAVVVIVIGLGWFGRTFDGPTSGGFVSTGSSSESAANDPGSQADRLPGVVIGEVAMSDPLPDQDIPGTGLLGISGQVLHDRPERILARLIVAGRTDVVGTIADVVDGAFAGWLQVPAPDASTDAVLELYDAGRGPTDLVPLTRVRFRLDPPPPVTIERPSIPFEVIGTARLTVVGSAGRSVGYVLVRLEGRNNRLLDRVVVATVASDGEPLDGRRRYTVSIDLPAVHPNGTMIVEVTPLDGVTDPERYRLRLPVSIGPLAP